MKLLKNRKIAALLMVLMILGGSLYGGHRSLMKLRDEAEAVFYNGVEGDGLGIQNDLNERIDLAYNLVTVAKRYLSPDDEAVQKLLTARDALSSAQDPKEKNAANRQLTEASIELYEAFGGRSLTEKDEKYRQQIYQDLSSRNDTISHDGYNQEAEDFNKTLRSFPAGILASLTGVEKLELFR